MPGHYDSLETRPPDRRENEQFAGLPKAVAHAMVAPGWAKQLAGVVPATVTSRAALARLPVLRKSDIAVLQKENPPFGGFNVTPPGKARRLLMSPGPIFEPEGEARDWWGAARALFAAGFRAGDVVHNSFAYHLTPGGFILESGAHALGCAVIPGGVGNNATNYAFAAGSQAKALHTGAFVWADSIQTDFISDRTNQFKVRAGGGMYLQAGSSGLNPAALRVECTGTTGVAIHANQTSSDSTTVFANRGSGDLIKGFSGPSANNLVFRVANAGDVYAQSYNPISDRNAKENFQSVSPREVLARVTALPILQWNFKLDADTKHIGPMAQDFHAAFGVGPDDKHIATVDADGVALAAIQGLNQKVESGKREAETEIQSLKAENAELKARLEKLEQLFNRKQDGGAK